MTDTPDDTAPAEARSLLAWLMWCYQQGYRKVEDRAILTSWIDDDPAILHPDDIVSRDALLTMADEVLALVEPLIAARAAADQLERDVNLAIECGAVVPAEYFKPHIPVPFTPFADLLAARDTP